MTIKEQQHIRRKGYAEAMRYIALAGEELEKAGKSFKHPKYVNSARGIAYKGVLIALESLLQLKGVDIPKYEVDKKNSNFNGYEFYSKNFRKLDKKLLRHFGHVYEDLYKSSYLYCDPILLKDGILDDKFELAKEIIHNIKPCAEVVRSLAGSKNLTQEVL